MDGGTGWRRMDRAGFFKLCLVSVATPLLVAAGCGGEEDDDDDEDDDD